MSRQTTDSDTAPDLTGTPTSVPSESSPPSVDWYNDDVSPPQFFSLTAPSLRVPLVITRPNRNNTSSPSPTVPSIQSTSTRSSSSSSHSAGAMRTLSFLATTSNTNTSDTSHNQTGNMSNNNNSQNDGRYSSLLSARSRSRSRDDDSSLAWSPPVSPVMRGKSASSTSKSKSIRSPKSPKKKKSKSEGEEEDIQHTLCLNLAKDALKVNDAMVYLEGPAIYTCSECRTHLTSHDEIISKSFHGRHGRAYLFDQCVNITTGPAEDRRLITGLHSVCDIFCKRCRTLIGWTYARAYEPSQRYKEGKFIIEKINLHMEESDYYQVTQPAGERRDKWKIRSMSWSDESYSQTPRHRHDEASVTSTVYEYRSRARSSSTISWASIREIPTTPP